MLTCTSGRTARRWTATEGMRRAAPCPPVLVPLDIYPRFVAALIGASSPPQKDPVLEVDLKQAPHLAEAEIPAKVVRLAVTVHRQSMAGHDPARFVTENVGGCAMRSLVAKKHLFWTWLKRDTKKTRSTCETMAYLKLDPSCF